MTTKQIPVWIDCDTGTDDSVAIMLAHALPELSVVALSAVAGNSPLYNTFRTHGASCICWAPIIRSIPARSAPLCGNRTWPASSMAKTASEMSSCPCRTERLKPHPRGTHSMKRRSECRANCVWSRPGR